MAHTLPYEGYSWSINQHVALAKPSYMFPLLEAAYRYSNFSDYQDMITDHLVRLGLFTPNFRKDQSKASLWRDYQQILSEFGLIFSTKITKEIVITPIGLMWLDGAIGYKELMTTQCLNYQYPNGHKQDISPALRSLLQGKNSSVRTRTELDATNGVLLKPAILILRVLFELFRRNSSSEISIPEIATALLPTKLNNDWPKSLARLYSVRRSGNFQRFDSRVTRHLQEWLRFLDTTDLFTKYRQVIRLSDSAIQNPSAIERILEFHENPRNCWLPTNFDSTDAGFSWFKYYGTPSLERQWALAEEMLTPEYIEINYPEGLLDEVEAEKNFSSGKLSLVEFQERSRTFSTASSANIDVDKIKAGRKSIAEKTRLHDSIVSQLANRLTYFGYEVFVDPQSIDLLARKDDNEILFEVKTVNNNNLFRHMRLGVGQILEYRYRRSLEVSNKPSGYLVLSSKFNFPGWVLSFFSEDINLGLIGLEQQNKFTVYNHCNPELEPVMHFRS